MYNRTPMAIIAAITPMAIKIGELNAANAPDAIPIAALIPANANFTVVTTTIIVPIIPIRVVIAATTIVIPATNLGCSFINS